MLLESGTHLDHVELAYQTRGRLNASGDNAILICHALTGDAHAWGDPGHPGWWEGLIGPGKALDPDRYFLICSNVLGGCYGSTGPVAAHPADGLPWGNRFPSISVRDMVHAQRALLRRLGVRRLHAVIGGSLGGFQVLEWGALYPHFCRALIPMATTARHRPWAVAFNELGRRAITNDPVFNAGAYQRQPSNGLALARMSALISYRSHPAYEAKFAGGSDPRQEAGRHPVSSYLGYQGDKFHRRFDANTYLGLLDAMDGHDLGRDRDGVARAAAQVDVPMLWPAFDSDELYPLEEQQTDAARFPNCRFEVLSSPEGHDAFLIETELLNPHIAAFLEVC